MKAFTRFMSVVLAVVMLLSFSVSNLFIVAAGGENDAPDNGGNNNAVKPLELDKWFTPATKVVDGKEVEDWSHGTLTLEAFATGNKVTVEKHQPIAAVLVLDVSGSMSYDYTYNTVCGNTQNVSALDTSKSYLFDSGNKTYDLQYRNGKWQYKRTNRITWSDFAGSNFERTSLSVYITTTTSRINALKNAVEKFIDTIYEDAVKNGAEHKISIVKFGTAAYYSTNHLTEGNHKNSSSYNYCELVKAWTTVDSETNKTALVNQVKALTTGGATAADYGMTIAKEELNDLANKVENVDDYLKMALLFTDGSPTHGSDFSTTVANNAIAQSKAIKDTGAVVYSVGILENATNDQTAYMNRVSSNYPNATTYQNGTHAADNFYKDATKADISEIFKSIAEDTCASAVNLTEEACLMDEITEFFEIPEGVKAEDIVVKTSAWLGGQDYNASNGWGDPKTFNATVTIDNKDSTVNNRVYVTNFNYKEESCALGVKSGSKLIIEIPIALRTPAEVTALAQGQFKWDEAHQAYKVPTNTTLSGIYTSKDLAEKVEDAPELEGFVPGTTYLNVVTYVVDLTIDGAVKTGENWTAPSMVYEDVEVEQVYKQFVVLENSETPAVDDPSVYGYSFAGWTPAVAETVTGNPVYIALWTPLTFKVYHSSNKQIDEIELIKVLPTADSTNTFDITECVRGGYIYGGVFTNSDFVTAKTHIENDTDNGLAFVPKAGETYYLKEVNKYFYDSAYFVTIFKPQRYSDDGTGKEINRVVGVYGLVDFDCDQYKGFGFDFNVMSKEDLANYHDGKEYNADNHSQYLEYTGNTFDNIVIKKESGEIEKTLVADEGGSIGVTKFDFGSFTHALPHGNEAEMYLKDLAFTANAFYVTMDGIRVQNRFYQLSYTEGDTAFTSEYPISFASVYSVFDINEYSQAD